MSFSFFLFLPTTTARQQDDSKTGETLDHSQKEWLGVSSLLSHALSTGLCSLIIAAGGELAAASRTRNSREGCDWHSRQAESEKTASTVLASTIFPRKVEEWPISANRRVRPATQGSLSYLCDCTPTTTRVRARSRN